MSIHINVKGQNRAYLEPNICPHCHVTNLPTHRWHESSEDTDGNSGVISSWLCANRECKKIFVCEYLVVDNNLVFNRFLNGHPKGPSWPEPIEDLQVVVDGKPVKSKFIKIYLQSLKAETSGLDELAGMGYRKAIEFLVKDWAIATSPASEHANIRKSWLGQVIAKYYTGDLKDILERAVWLGNDQTHYLRLFDEYDVGVLKELLGLVLVELDRLHKLNHYKNTITARKPS